MDTAHHASSSSAGDWMLVGIERLRLMVPRDRVRAVHPCSATWLESADRQAPTWPADTGNCPVLVLDEWLRPAPERLATARQILLLEAAGRVLGLACERAETIERAEPPAFHRLPPCMAAGARGPVSLALLADGAVASVMEAAALEALAAEGAAHG